MNIYLSLISLAILITVLILQLKNLSKYWDGNGEMKTRVLFIEQVVMLITIAVCDIFRWPHVSAIAVVVLSFNSLAFYMQWNYNPLLWVIKLFKK